MNDEESTRKLLCIGLLLGYLVIALWVISNLEM